jgi:hypothetical protein
MAHARFLPQTGSQQGQEIVVHFNPASLVYIITNTLREQGRGNRRKQYVSQSTGKLTMDLIFDTTHNGEDVRVHTEKVARLMEPVPERGQERRAIPAIVRFEWGTYTFQGMVESYRETIDFFAPTGVPLRASINLTLARQDEVFESSSSSRFDMPQPEPVDVLTGPGEDTTRIGTRGGNARAGRDIAAMNGEESMRQPRGNSLTISPTRQLRPPVDFASGAGQGDGGMAAGLAGGGAVDIGGSLGGAGRIGSGIAPAGGARTGQGIFGGAASAGVSTSAGAFAGLRPPVRRQRPSHPLDIGNFLQPSESLALSTDSRASFRVGGQTSLVGSTSLSADVGNRVSLRSRLQFEEE